MIDYSSHLLLKNHFKKNIYNYVVDDQLQTSFGVFRYGEKRKYCKQLKSFLTSRVSCLSPWTRQNFPAPLKVEQTLSFR